jgi:O-antigen/teichoic acid export membrane protein
VSVKRNALGAIGAQGMQALASFVLQVLVVKSLGLSGLGTFSILFGVIVLVTALLTGFVGDSLVVLDRRERTIRSALEQYALGLSTVAALICAAVAFASGLVSLTQSILFALAIVLFVLEEMIRRLLMANIEFWRVAAIDLSAFAGMLCIVGVSALNGPLTLELFLLAISAGQVIAIGIGILLLPSEERFAVAFTSGGHRAVASYGSWRASQQLLRPTLLTAVRTLVTLFLGLEATGLLEAGRVYVAPAMLVVSGFTSFLFVSFARDKAARVRDQLPKADRIVGALLGITVLLGAALLLALPFVGRLLFGTVPQFAAVLGWLAYTASVSAVTPYGALAAVGNKQAFVFWIRLTETIGSALTVLTMLALGAGAGLMPVVLTIWSALGGLAIRTFILVPLARAERGSLPD